MANTPVPSSHTHTAGTPDQAASENSPKPKHDAAALEQATRTLYDSLKAIARAHLGSRRGEGALEPTDIVHECFLRLAKADQFQFLGREEFLGLASRVLRQVLVDHARSQGRLKRGPEWQRVTLSGALVADPAADIDLVDLNDALDKLARLDARQARIVELRFLGGLEMSEIARLTQASLGEVEDEWVMARAWLRRELRR